MSSGAVETDFRSLDGAGVAACTAAARRGLSVDAEAESGVETGGFGVEGCMRGIGFPYGTGSSPGTGVATA